MPGLSSLKLGWRGLAPDDLWDARVPSGNWKACSVPLPWICAFSALLAKAGPTATRERLLGLVGPCGERTSVHQRHLLLGPCRVDVEQRAASGKSMMAAMSVKEFGDLPAAPGLLAVNGPADSAIVK